MKNNRLLKNKMGKGIVSLLTVIVLMSSILAGTFYNQRSITGNAVAEDLAPLNTKLDIYKMEVNDVSELNQLNEGWYKIVSGNVLYLETFDSTIPLFIKVKNPEQQNGLLVVDFDGNIKFEADSWEVASAERIDAKAEGNLITGEVTGLEGISGMQITPTSQDIEKIKNDNLRALEITDAHKQSDGSYILPNLGGRFKVNPDGSIFFEGIKENAQFRVPPQTFANGKWYYGAEIKEGTRIIASVGDDVPPEKQAMTEKRKNDNIQELGLQRITNGVNLGKYIKPGQEFPGIYEAGSDGKIYYSGDWASNIPAQIYDNGIWYSEDRRYQLWKLSNNQIVKFGVSGNDGSFYATSNGVEYEWNELGLCKKNAQGRYEA